MNQTTNNQKKLFESCPDIMTVQEVAQIMGIDRAAVYKLINENALSALKIGNAFKIPRSSLLDYVEKNCGKREGGI